LDKLEYKFDERVVKLDFDEDIYLTLVQRYKELSNGGSGSGSNEEVPFDIDEDIAEIDTEAGILRLLTPNDCIKDRLAAYYHWDDEQCLQQAVWVAQQNEFYLESVQEWSIKESAEDKFVVFEGMIKSSINNS